MRLEDVRVGMKVKVDRLSLRWLLVIADFGDTPQIGQVGEVVSIDPSDGWVIARFDAWGSEKMLPEELEPAEVQA